MTGEIKRSKSFIYLNIWSLPHILKCYSAPLSWLLYRQLLLDDAAISDLVKAELLLQDSKHCAD